MFVIVPPEVCDGGKYRVGEPTAPAEAIGMDVGIVVVGCTTNGD